MNRLFARAIVISCVVCCRLSDCFCAQMALNESAAFEALPTGLVQTWLTESEARFTRRANGFVWISDIEHVIFPKSDAAYLADADPPYYFCGTVVPGGTDFELFPYHHYKNEEVERLGARINYRLIAKNITSRDVVLELKGVGTTRDWDHYKTWEGALRGDGRRVITLKPNETVTLWEEQRLEGEMPWSGIFLGRASGDLWVCDYAYRGEKDPGIAAARQMPDLAQPPTLWPSFTRGTAQWNAADIELFPNRRTPAGRLSLAHVEPGIYSFAFADSPGGPLDKPCVYSVVPATFAADELPVLDPVSQKSHLFFGGNYPIMYHIRFPLANDSQTTRTLSFLLCSNDKFNVDTIAGVSKIPPAGWIGGTILHRRVPAVGKNQHWRVFSAALPPGGSEDIEFIVVALGSRWGGIIASLVVN